MAVGVWVAVAVCVGVAAVVVGEVFAVTVGVPCSATAVAPVRVGVCSAPPAGIVDAVPRRFIMVIIAMPEAKARKIIQKTTSSHIQALERRRPPAPLPSSTTSKSSAGVGSIWFTARGIDRAGRGKGAGGV